jgi:demethylmenaquinone methyltransferase/2-methoxy-6-polyprenyl-1,4-benzoquinol methylase
MKEDVTDFGFTKVKIEEKRKLVGKVFDSVADSYDIMNDLMSLGVHRLWKRHAIALTQVRANMQVLDLAAGTGDLSALMAPLVGKHGHITLCDINMSMLEHAQMRLIDKGFVENINIVQANAEHLPFEANTFDRITIGFGLRNVTFKEKAVASMYRVLKPGGRMTILEFSHPTNSAFSKIYDAYSFHLLPKLGQWIAKDSASYQYLAESIRMHPDQEALKALILEAGFDKCDYHNLTGGIVAIHQGIKY